MQMADSRIDSGTPPAESLSYLHSSPTSTPDRKGAGGGGGRSLSHTSPQHHQQSGSPSSTSGSPAGSYAVQHHSGSMAGRFPPPPAIAGGHNSPLRYDVVEAVIGTPESQHSQHSVHAVLVPSSAAAASVAAGSHMTGPGSGSGIGSHTGGTPGSGSGTGSGPRATGGMIRQPVLVGAGSAAGGLIGHASPQQLQLHSPQHQHRQPHHNRNSSAALLAAASTSAQYGTPVAGMVLPSGTSLSGIVQPGTSTQSGTGGGGAGTVTGDDILRLPHSYASYLQPPQPTRSGETTHTRSNNSPPLVPASSSIPHRGDTSAGGGADGRRSSAAAAQSAQPLVPLTLPDSNGGGRFVSPQHPHQPRMTATTARQNAVFARQYLAGRVLWTDSVSRDLWLFQRDRHPALACCSSIENPITGTPHHPVASRRSVRVVRLLSVLAFAWMMLTIATIRWGCNQCPTSDDCVTCVDDSGGVFGADSFRHALHPCDYCSAPDGVSGTVVTTCVDQNPTSFNAFGINQFSARVSPLCVASGLPNTTTITQAMNCPARLFGAATGGGWTADGGGSDRDPACTTATIVYVFAVSIAAAAIYVYQIVVEAIARSSVGICCDRDEHSGAANRAVDGGDDTDANAADDDDHTATAAAPGADPDAAADGGDADAADAIRQDPQTYTSIDADGHRIDRHSHSTNKSSTVTSSESDQPSNRRGGGGGGRKHKTGSSSGGCCDSIVRSCRGYGGCDYSGSGGGGGVVASSVMWWSSVLGVLSLVIGVLAFRAVRDDQSTALGSTAVAIAASWVVALIGGSFEFGCRRMAQSDRYRDRPQRFQIAGAATDASPSVIGGGDSGGAITNTNTRRTQQQQRLVDSNRAALLDADHHNQHLHDQRVATIAAVPPQTQQSRFGTAIAVPNAHGATAHPQAGSVMGASAVGTSAVHMTSPPQSGVPQHPQTPHDAPHFIHGGDDDGEVHAHVTTTGDSYFDADHAANSTPIH